MEGYNHKNKKDNDNKNGLIINVDTSDNYANNDRKIKYCWKRSNAKDNNLCFSVVNLPGRTKGLEPPSIKCLVLKREQLQGDISGALLSMADNKNNQNPKSKSLKLKTKSNTKCSHPFS